MTELMTDGDVDEAPPVRWRVQVFWQDSEGVEHPHGHLGTDEEALARHWYRSNGGIAPSPFMRVELQRRDGPPGTPWTTIEAGKYSTEEGK